jgi:chromosome partitioning protein
MRVIAVANSKGGSGKTATVFNLGAELARRGEKVLLWDIDPQASLTDCFKIPYKPSQIYTEDALATDKIDVTQAPVQMCENLYIIPATQGLGGLEGTLEHSTDNLLRLRRCLDRLKHLEFSYVILDPPGSTDIFMSAALAAAQEVLIPVRPTDTDFTAMVNFKADIEKIKSINPELEVRGILFNQVITSSKNYKIYKAFLEEAKWDALVCQTSIRMATTVANAPGTGKDVISFDPKSKAADDYRALATEILLWNTN